MVDPTLAVWCEVGRRASVSALIQPGALLFASRQEGADG